MIDYAKLAAVDFSNAEMEDFEERAAIIEHDGGYSKNEAEKQAYMAMLAERAWIKTELPYGDLITAERE